MANKEYSEAYTEVLEILKHTEQEYVEKIPQEMMKILKANASKTYKVNFDFNKEISDMDLKPETLNVLAIIYRNYWCTKEEKAEFDKNMMENEIQYQAQLHEKYNPDKLFEKPDKEEKLVQTENLPIEIKKEGFYQKLVSFLKRFFGKK